LERKKLAVLVSRPDGSWRLLGSLNPYLNEALQFVMNQKEITARDLADDTQVEISLASTKLLNLFKARLVQRSSERLPDGGRQFIYRSLLVER
jgi:predicted transcriptional regulator